MIIYFFWKYNQVILMRLQNVECRCPVLHSDRKTHLSIYQNGSNSFGASKCYCIKIGAGPWEKGQTKSAPQVQILKEYQKILKIIK